MSAAFLIGLQLRSANEARFQSFGQTCRQLCVAVLLGLDAVALAMEADVSASTYYISGYSRLEPRLRRWCAIVAVSAHVSDSVVYDLMQDDRLCCRLPEVEDNMHLEVAYVNSLDPLVWTTLANLVGESGSPQQLMSDALVAAHAAAAYIDERIFVPARGMPFALCSGDVHMNLELLGRPGPMHEDEATQRIASLVRMRHSRAELVRLVSMFNELSWSSKKVEEDHAPGHKLRNHHNQYGQDMQLQRSFVCGLLSMVRQGKERAPLVRARKKLAILQKKQPRKATGRHMFSADALRATSAAYAGLSAEVRARAGADTMRRHGVQHAALSSDVKRDFQRRAATEAATRQHAINEEIFAVRTCIFGEEQRDMDERQGSSLVCKVGGCRCSEQDLRDLDLMLQDRERWSGRAASALRERACAPAATPSPQRMETLGSLRVSGVGASRPEIHDWLIEICKQRDWFRRTALRVMREGQERWYLVLFACQRPFQLSCLPLTPRLVTVGRPNMGEQEIYACMSSWHVYTFTVVERV